MDGSHHDIEVPLDSAEAAVEALRNSQSPFGNEWIPTGHGDLVSRSTIISARSVTSSPREAEALMSVSTPAYPVRVEGHLDPQLSRWLWLVKWVLVIPHAVVLAFLWVGFVVVSVIAFFAILFTGRYPLSLFEFNVGVLRWTWRVGFYAFSANGTDRYPPFTLADGDYPATLQVVYPERLSRGLVLVKWWLLAIPQYLVVAVFVGGTGSFDRRLPGLVSLLVLIAVVALLFTGRYPRSIFDFVLGMNRWVLRVAAYAMLMTDRYPPFRLDMGENEPGAGALIVGAPTAVAPETPAATTRWGAGRIVLLVVGSILGLLSLAALAAGGAATVIDQTQRDANGYLMTGPETYETNTYAFVSGTYKGGVPGADLALMSDLLGTVRITSDSAQPVFVGIARPAAVDRYLGTVNREQARNFTSSRSDYKLYTGGKPATPPTAQQIWATSITGSGAQTLTWKPRSGNWRVVLMNADGTPGPISTLNVGARVPDLLSIGIGLLAGAALLLLISGATIYAAVPKRTRS